MLGDLGTPFAGNKLDDRNKIKAIKAKMMVEYGLSRELAREEVRRGSVMAGDESFEDAKNSTEKARVSL